jgi:hypothetical protein
VIKAIGLFSDEAPDHSRKVDRIGWRQDLVVDYGNRTFLAAQAQHSLNEIAALSRAAGDAVKARSADYEMPTT